MSEEQLSALLAKLRDDAALREKLQGAADLNAAEVIAKDAGFDVNKADWLMYQGSQALGVSDQELEQVVGGDAKGRVSDSRMANTLCEPDCKCCIATGA